MPGLPTEQRLELEDLHSTARASLEAPPMFLQESTIPCSSLSSSFHSSDGPSPSHATPQSSFHHSVHRPSSSSSHATPQSSFHPIAASMSNDLLNASMSDLPNSR